MTSDFAKNIITKMASDYNAIARHFAQTRQQPWPEFSILKKLIANASLVGTGRDLSLLDVGCGNGRLVPTVKNTEAKYTGIDISKELIKHAQQQFPDQQFIQGSMLNLPLADNTFDVVACIAALQHIPSVRYRLQALQEMWRVTKPGGTVFMLNWNLYQSTLPNYFIAAQKKFGDQWETGDALVPWKNDQGEILAQRYYHGFHIDELIEVCQQAGWTMTKCELMTSQHNILTITQKTS